jgi:hypothetical protein
MAAAINPASKRLHFMQILLLEPENREFRQNKTALITKGILPSIIRVYHTLRRNSINLNE